MKNNLIYKKNIFFIINSMHAGGAERVAANLTKAFEKRYNVYLILLNEQTANDYQSGGKVIVLNDGKKRNKISQYLFYKSKVERLAQELNPQVVISFLLNACLCNIIAKTHATKILSIRNYLKKQFKGKKLMFWECCFKYLFKKGDIVVSVSNHMEQDLIKSYNLKPSKSKVIYNPYNIEEIEEATRQPIEEKYLPIFKQRVIITMGSLHKQKGQCHLIRAYAELLKTVKDTKLVIIGKCNSENNIEEKLKRLVRDLNIENDVIFLGHQTNPHKYLKRAVVFAFPSLYEGFPNALVEAMICGLPIISSDCETGPREILAPDTYFLKKADSVEECKYGILIPTAEHEWIEADVPLTNDEIMLKQALIELLTNPIKRNYYSEKSVERGKMFALDMIIDQWMKILQ